MIFKGSKRDVAAIIYNSVHYGVKGALTIDGLVNGYSRSELEQLAIEFLNKSAFNKSKKVKQ